MNIKEQKLHKTFMEVAKNISQLSNCVSHKVGAVLVKDNRIVSTGYNGTPPGFINCCDKFPNYSIDNREEHHNFSKKFEIHAELNTILCAAKNGISTNDCILYCTLQPCNECLKIICNSGIKTVYFDKFYDKAIFDQDVTQMLIISNVKVLKLNI